ncbi:UDP-glucose:glycoprotein glucosyltransferase 2 [Boothiomyces macroporosus]|uniref:UDP-glucose:glycoprotein glucosyltransferase 2 n=1 Tax=Boothiomyces macroporosus TaxID=261099 RepID=A0AAD5YA37_9FUNG|nr:UDP-glucose:glycoprotein glucosyltransferase 2 [Boothiomyces macroporosus]
MGLEIAQFIVGEGQSPFEFIEWAKANTFLANETTERLYDYLFTDNKIKQFVGNDHAVDLLKVAIATHANAPSVQAFYHYYKESVIVGRNLKDCPVWVDLDGIQHCEPSSLPAKIINKKLPALLEFDNFYSKKHSNNIAILYADVYSPDYIPFYFKLRELAEEGDFNFVLRYRPSSNTYPTIALSGYGVELAIKSTEYAVVDDRVVEGGSDADLSVETKDEDSLNIFNEKEPKIVRIPKEAISNVENRLIAFAANSSDGLGVLTFASQNFPKVAHLVPSSPKNLKEVSSVSSSIIGTLTGLNQNLFLNGLAFDVDSIDAYTLLNLMRSENQNIAKLNALGFTVSDAIELFSSVKPSTSNLEWGECFDTRTPRAIWLNDLEKEARYERFQSGIDKFAQPSFMGQFKFVRKNFFSFLFLLDLTDVSQASEIGKIYQIISQLIPVRFGLVPIKSSKISDEHFKIIASAVYGIAELQSYEKMELFLRSYVGKLVAGGDPVMLIQKVFADVAGTIFKKLDEKELYEDLQEIQVRLGISDDGGVFANGEYFSLEGDWARGAVQTYFKMLDYLQKIVLAKKITNDHSVYDHFMDMPNVYAKRNQLIFSPEEELVFVDFGTDKKILEGLEWHYGTSKLTVGPEEDKTTYISMVIFANLDTKQGLEIAISSLKMVEEDSEVRATIVNTSPSSESSLVDKIIGDGLKVKDLIQKLESSGLGEKSTFVKNIETIDALLSIAGFSKGQNGIVINGRVLGPFTESNIFDKDDIHTLVGYEYNQRAANIGNAVLGFFVDKELDRQQLSDIILLTSAILNKYTSSLKRKYNRISMTNYLLFADKPKSNSPFQFLATVQPLTTTGQKILSMLSKFKRIPGVAIDVLAAGTPQETEDIPLKRFYRFNFETAPQFDKEGSLIPATTFFSKIPTSSLLTLGMDVPGSWLVRPKKSIYDLDNIKMSSVPKNSNLFAEFSLESILVEGHAMDVQTKAAPRGLQFVLGTDSQPTLAETITMANLGYIQLKASPGAWILSIREGKSSKVYSLSHIGNSKSPIVIVNSYEGITIRPKVSKKPGMEDVDVLDGEQNSGGSLWSSIKNKIIGSKKSETINVFSVASGHLYERFLSIMMLSVKRQTNSPVKFWLIENFLSPSFLEFLPHLSKAFDFEYELVTYKWPHWLRKQTEKQRIIWGYKILFLDVIFPLSVEKIIFVDADQVVRADLKELVDMDLNGAVYGYTPFCSSRTEMDGFRFWKSGYWQQHLNGRPYHISALYVIDLVKFRAVAAGDRLRQQYHALSADPNSLSNLDQDLPNNMIHEIPIFSLPQDWLWCETWCSDESLKTAKTIDLCNNPLTKEPKLQRAKRILPEWEGYDQEIQHVRDTVVNIEATQQDSSSMNEQIVKDEL